MVRISMESQRWREIRQRQKRMERWTERDRDTEPGREEGRAAGDTGTRRPMLTGLNVVSGGVGSSIGETFLPAPHLPGLTQKPHPEELTSGAISPAPEVGVGALRDPRRRSDKISTWVSQSPPPSHRTGRSANKHLTSSQTRDTVWDTH